MSKQTDISTSDKNEIGNLYFWRNLVVLFCAMSIVGHWIEIVYCFIMQSLFGIVDPDSLVWDDPFYPFLVYGIGATLCVFLLNPLRNHLNKQNTSEIIAGAKFFVYCILGCMAMELGMGLLLNQPDENGEYPLWDNSELPLNIFDQAWLVNDILLGAVAVLYTWIIYPACIKAINRIPANIANIGSTLFVIGFIILCVCKFS